MATTSTARRGLQHALQSAVQSIQWTYIIFWNPCPQQRELVWGDGYYNGDTKTRKMVQPVENTTSLHRSQQLRELYRSLSDRDMKNPMWSPCSSLLPEDLTDGEWLYLLSASFSFPPGIGLVTVLAVWLPYYVL